MLMNMGHKTKEEMKETIRFLFLAFLGLYSSSIIILLIMMILALTGCSDTSLKAKSFDSLEYSIAVSVSVEATRAIHLCSTTTNPDLREHIKNINTHSLTLDEYVRNKKDSSGFIVPVTNLRHVVNDLIVMNTFSPNFCVHKLSNIQVMSRIIERGLTDTDKDSMCQGGLEERLKLFNNSYVATKITKEEFKNLTGDLANMVEVNKAVCSAERTDSLFNNLDLLKSSIGLILSL